MRFDRTGHSNCGDCPLQNETRVWSEGPADHIQAVIIGEAPGEKESIAGKPFIGASGDLLNEGLNQAGFRRARCWITNTISCRPPDNKITSPEAQEAITCCSPGLKAELAYLTQQEVGVYLPMGNTALKALGIDGKIMTVRGSPYKLPTNTALPIPHPAAIFRNWSLKPVWFHDLRKAKAIQTGGWEPVPERFNLFPTLIDLALIPKNTLLACDIETTALRPDQGDIVCICIMWSESDGLVFPFLKQGGGSYWGPEEELAKYELRNILSQSPTMWQNVLYDVTWLDAKEFPVSNIKHDTILAHHAIDPELPHKLEFIASVYADTSTWKAPFQQREGRITDMDDTELRTYCARDGAVLHQIHPPLHDDIKEEGVERTYDLSLRLVPPIIRLARAGVLFDAPRLIAWKKELDTQLKKTRKDLTKAAQVPADFRWSSPDDVRYLVYGWTPSSVTTAQKTLDEIKTKKLRTDTKKYHAAIDRTEILKITPLYLPNNVHIRKTDTHRPEIGEQAMLALQISISNRKALIDKFITPKKKHLDELKEINRVLLFHKLYREEAELRKIISTYTSYRPEPDGRVHSSFAIHLVNSGRFSSSRPNLQNLPDSARQLFVAPKGAVFLSRDYSNLELRVLAIIAQDEESMRIFAEGKNVHDENTKVLWQTDKDDPLWDVKRKATKTDRFGTNYGGSERGIFEKVAMQCPEAGLTFAQFQASHQLYAKLHQGEEEWRKKIIQQVQSTQKVRNAFGRQRTFRGSMQEIRREAVNFPIQSTAADIINEAFIKIDAMIQQLGLKTQIVLQVHDQLVLECPYNELSLMLTVTRDYMEAPVVFNLVPGEHAFPTDASIGARWSQLIKADTWLERFDSLLK